MMKKWSLLLIPALLLILAMVACEANPQTVEVTRIVTETVIEQVLVEGEPQIVEKEVTRVITEPAEEPAAEESEMATERVYRIGMHADPATMNFWNMVGPGGSGIWTWFVLGQQNGILYTESDQRFDYVPSLAADLPPEPVQESDLWTITVEMVPDATWSDGVPITAHDVAFTLNTCQDLELAQGWAGFCNPDILKKVEAVDDFSVKYTFTDRPGLSQWQYGVATAPILPEHFWGEVVADALALVEGLEEPLHPQEAEDCSVEELSPEETAICEPYLAEMAAFDEAYTNARSHLYDADPTGAPSAGAFINDEYEPGAYASRSANSNYYFAGSEIVETDDGAWTRTMADGRSLQLYGDGSGQETLHYTVGPYVDNIIFSIYSDQSASFLSLVNGDVDYVMSLNPGRGLREMAENNPNIHTYSNPDNGIFYLAFNVRKEPFSDPAFREAVDYLIDKEFVTENVLQGTVIPTYSIVPQGNRFWYNEDLETPTVGLSRSERLVKAMEILEAAGYSWDQKPVWDSEDPDAQNLVDGIGLRKPDGSLIEPFVILGPGPAYDPMRATFNQWISSWMRQIGIPVESELTGFNTILNPVFIDATFDMYILGWALTIYPDYLCLFFDSRYDVLNGGANAPGFNDADFDARCDDLYAETDIERAKEQTDELQDILAEERPYIPLFVTEAIDYVRTNVAFPYTESLGGIFDQAGLQNSVQILASK